ncbi:stress protein [Chromatium okenii]|uniref:TerD family protein n=1 Tax=Chromatium okenii TaxID=61644 RepID=UPI0019056303|nr:TerD family protein [Chromatium okenii]MBK1642455.1 stress protein [Chromatium okenii]
MAIELLQGANAAISEQHISITISWQTTAIEADASAFLINSNGKIRTDEDFIFYNQTTSACGGLTLATTTHNHRQFRARLNQLPADIVKVIFTMTIATAADATGCPHCGMMEQLLIQMSTAAGNELLHFQPKIMGKERALILGELYRHQGGWKFRAVGQGYNGGLDILAHSFGVNIQAAAVSNHVDPHRVESNSRAASKQEWTKKAATLQHNLRAFLPQINSAVTNGANESNTRMILDRILIDVFGYSMDEVKAEQKIQGRKADYVLAIDGVDVIVGESKRAGLTLRDKHIFQATSYGAYSGIRWALLTNLSTWQIYHISTQNIVDATLVFSVDLLPDIRVEDCERLLLMTRFGMAQPEALEQYWREVNALTRDSLIQAILTEDVVNSIRTVIKRDTGCDFDNDTVQQVLVDVLIHP